MKGGNKGLQVPGFWFLRFLFPPPRILGSWQSSKEMPIWEGSRWIPPGTSKWVSPLSGRRWAWNSGWRSGLQTKVCKTPAQARKRGYRWSRGAWAQEERAKWEEAVEQDGPPDKWHAGDAGGMNPRGMRVGGVCETSWNASAQRLGWVGREAKPWAGWVARRTGSQRTY